MQRFRIEIKYKSDKINIILNTLFRLISRLHRFEINKSIFDTMKNYLINLITINEIFRKRFFKNYQKSQ